uniref:Ig-like domain-containing protein n=1 Tax=Amphiprion ocellaris TaxID=80972 RepID=A0AAQ5ZDG6_AMPOC
MKLQFLLSILSACCLLSGLDSEEPKVIGSHDTITAAVGEDVILPCHLEPPFDVHNLTVLWKHNGAAVHTYKSRGDNLDAQDKSFKNRTLFFHGEMVNGNISLKLFNVTEQDKGVYTCVVPRLDSQVRKGNVTLEVVPKGKEEEIEDDPTSGPSTDENNLSTAHIIGITIGVIAIIVIVIVIVVKRRRGQQEENPDDTVL